MRCKAHDSAQESGSAALHMGLKLPHRRAVTDIGPIQALCELLTKAGKKLEASTKSKAKFEATFTTLDKLSKHKKLAPRMKFLVRDVIDLRKSSWIPRRDTLQVRDFHNEKMVWVPWQRKNL